MDQFQNQQNQQFQNQQNQQFQNQQNQPVSEPTEPTVSEPTVSGSESVSGAIPAVSGSAGSGHGPDPDPAVSGAAAAVCRAAVSGSATAVSGSGNRAGQQRQSEGTGWHVGAAPPSRRGPSEKAQIEVTLLAAISGADVSVRTSRQRTIEVHIPAGVRTGTQLDLRNSGPTSEKEYVRLTIQKVIPEEHLQGERTGPPRDSAYAPGHRDTWGRKCPFTHPVV